MSAFNALNTTIYTVLTGASGLTSLLNSGSAVYYVQAPDNASYDYVVYSWQAGGDDNQTPSRMKNLLLFARGYSRTGPAKAGSIDAQIDSAINGVTMSVSGWSNFWTAREEDLAAVEIDPAGQRTWMAGGTYRIRIGEP